MPTAFKASSEHFICFLRPPNSISAQLPFHSFFFYLSSRIFLVSQVFPPFLIIVSLPNFLTSVTYYFFCPTFLTLVTYLNFFNINFHASLITSNIQYYRSLICLICRTAKEIIVDFYGFMHGIFQYEHANTDAVQLNHNSSTVQPWCELNPVPEDCAETE